MKLTTLLMILGCLHLNAAVFSQTISISERNVSLETLFSKIEKQSGYTFFYRMELIKAMPNVNVNLKNVTVEEALDQFLGKLSLSYSIIDNNIVIKSVPVQTNIKLLAPRIYIGKVLDEKDQPMPGVSVRVKNTMLVVVTNQEGQFITPVINDDKAILQFTYIGYTMQEIAVSELKVPIVIRLKLTSSDLDQVQITAYGSTTKRLATGNSTTITAEGIAKNPARNVLEVMQGQVPGLFVQQLSGLPGSPFNLMIRGQQTLTNGFRASQPLIIVDGVALPSGPLPLNQNAANIRENLNNELKGGNPLDYIDPSTIESLTVLKDADATSIYGSRGAYGVILITTKKGKAGSPKLNVNATSGLTMRGTSPEMLNTEQYIMLRTEAYKNDGTPITSAANFSDINGPNANRYTDFQKEYAGYHASVNRINASYSGGTSDINFLIGGNFRKQTSIQIGEGSVRDGGLNFNINNSVKNNKFNISLSGSFLSTTDDAVPYDFSQGNAYTSPPNSAPLFLPDGSLNWVDYTNNSNPAAAQNIIFKNITNNLFSTLGLKYTPVKGLSLNANIGYNYMNSKAIRAQPSTYYQPGTTFRTTSTLSFYTVRNITIEPNASYLTALGKKGTLTVQAGGTLQNQLNYSSSITGNDFLSDAMLYNPTFADRLTPGANPQANIISTYDQAPNKYLGFFGIINYNWDNKYILNLNGRRDGSTKFGENYQFGKFCSIALAYLFSNEKWFKSLLPVISFAKLRGSIGTSGGDGIPNYSFITTYSQSTPYQGSLGLQADNLENKDLHWEHNRKTDGGIFLEFFNGRISLDATYYDSKTSDQLINQRLPSTTGFTARSINSPAIIKNNGWEFELITKNLNGKKFTWSTRINLTLPKNKLVAYPGLGTTIIDLDKVIGKSVYGVKLYNYVGVDPETGLHNFINRNGLKSAFILPPFGDAALDINLDKTEYIDLSPKFYGGLGNSFSYKNITLDVFFTFTNRIGRTYLGSQSFPPGFPGLNTTTAALKRWQNKGDEAEVQRAGAGISSFFAQGNYVTSTGAYEKATYARLSSLNISYTLPDGLAKRLHLGSLTIFGQGSNLLTISKYGDLDPENLGAGMAPLRNFSGGLRVSL
ncbi:MAG TPA: SusC/RagA family TonB-linked outer membrane protein [Pedobacter sp.]|uniref:SusC/RagA family TonB-linked outer membrane protein n=1 Tax=Pedobacter sp. TaxID=1411316 RepID=UPI002BA12786|nr:SusC/RagA family TonB-linked outer membrane protein [Pedobacter sp.]HMI02878.1 SusC/RagA family TonB-linked outer membrane protein [Pedobacter sp.]